MSKNNGTRSGCKDVFNAFLVRDAEFDGILEIPCIKTGIFKPKKLISFSKCIRAREYDSWVHFYEDDAAFERIWKNPEKYLPILSRFEGVISPDFSLYRDMPLVMQYWNIYRNHAIVAWLQSNGIKVIPNIRYGDERTFEEACLGIVKHGTISIGSHGCIKIRKDRELFIAGLDRIVHIIDPQIIIIYGAAPDDIFGKYRNRGILILRFDSEFASSRKKVV